MWGRVLGAILGGLILRVPGVVVGFLLGLWFDLTYGKQLQGQGGLFGWLRVPQTQPQEATFFYAFFSAHGRLTKVKGVVTAADIRSAQQFMSVLKLEGEVLQQAQEAFRDGKSAQFPLIATIKQFRRDYHHRDVVSQSFLRQLIALLVRAQPLQKEQYDLLYSITKALGFSRYQLDRWIKMEAAQVSFDYHDDGTKKFQHLQEAKQVSAAYEILGVSRQATPQEIKQAYRKLMSAVHPDKLAAEGLPEEMYAATTRRAQDIQAAYAVLKKRWSR